MTPLKGWVPRLGRNPRLKLGRKTLLQKIQKKQNYFYFTPAAKEVGVDETLQEASGFKYLHVVEEHVKDFD